MVGKLMVLLFHNLLSLTIMVIIWTSAVRVPFLERVAPKYLRPVTLSSFSPFMMMFLLFHRVCSKILDYTEGATHGINVISKS
ncbi:hypothetical protein DPMN_023779 [Dreissena polymorpha]|uniref:Uncharacterized protein n=1 Tax=Dreissena polymorpha TaxID=45954 RepID=A0A9D4LMW0_DREPO|nr:hypothetical protein DPMN_023779 [Dreissena polymorpha]